MKILGLDDIVVDDFFLHEKAFVGTQVFLSGNRNILIQEQG